MNIKFKIALFVSIIGLAIVQGCESILEEHPKDRFTAAYYETTQGFQDGLNAAYASLRFQYGTNPSLGLNVTGTDEFTFGPEPNYNTSGDNLPHKLLGTYDVTPSAGYLTVTFNRTFPPINMLNGLIENAHNLPDATEDQKLSLEAEARYLRAHYYYLLVGQFGAVPLDLGSGELKFNTTAFFGFKRLDPDLLEKNYQAMIDDLTFASLNLPDKRPSGAAASFKLSKAVAFHLLSKIYLFRSYEPSLVKPTDAQDAYDAAMEIINNQATYGVGLQQNFADVFKQGNDYNSEILLAAERIPSNNVNNEYTNPSGIGDRENMAANCFTSNYQQPRLLLPAGANPLGGRPFAFQRPLRKLAPTPWLLNVAFADKVNDSRYHGSFRTLWTCDTQEAVGTANYTTFTNGLAALSPPRSVGDTAFYLADTEALATALSGKYYRVYRPSEWYTNQLYPTSGTAVLVYPSLTKFNDAQRANPNDASGRPMLIFRLAETYLNAAEAAFKTGNSTAAAELINVIRTRAAFRPGLSSGTLNTRVALMQIDASDINLDFILDERARELAGELLRWVDLARRGDDVFVNRVKLNPDVAAANKVQPFHRIRPIPQSQLDAIEDVNKLQYQNEGYTGN